MSLACIRILFCLWLSVPSCTRQATTKKRHPSNPTLSHSPRTCALSISLLKSALVSQSSRISWYHKPISRRVTKMELSTHYSQQPGLMSATLVRTASQSTPTSQKRIAIAIKRVSSTSTIFHHPHAPMSQTSTEPNQQTSPKHQQQRQHQSFQQQHFHLQ